jgi:hypothetical protein
MAEGVGGMTLCIGNVGCDGLTDCAAEWWSGTEMVWSEYQGHNEQRGKVVKITMKNVVKL